MSAAENLNKKSVRAISPERLTLLHSGQAASTNLGESLALDFALLLRNVLPGCPSVIYETMKRSSGLGILKRMKSAAELVVDVLGEQSLSHLASHPSDTARGWACFIVGGLDDIALTDRLEQIRPFADDEHFGVREWAWLAVRPHILSSLEEGISLLREWTSDPSERIRRFACESVRPRGVWCSHSTRLKQEPELALPILEPLRADPSRYVQDSVANWLNDASKTRPDWVRELCSGWLEAAPCPATERICKRAQRSLSR